MLSPRLLSLVLAAGMLVAVAPGCSSKTPATPQVGLVWVVQPGANAATCPVAGEDTFTIGGGNPEDSTVANGDTFNGAPISMSCTVSTNGSGFNVFATAQKGTGAQGTGGAVTISGVFDGTLNAQPNIKALFVDNTGTTASLSETDCTVTFPATQNGQGIAPGRVWAHIDCPTATDANNGDDCDASADFRFENCNQ